MHNGMHMTRTKKSSQPVKTQPPVKQRGFQLFEAIGRFSVKFRWLVLLVWLIGTVAAVHSFPSLTSVTQSDNSAFLPASSPTEKAIGLASVFGSANETPITVVIARSGASLTPADQQTIAQLITALDRVNGVKKVQDHGISPDGQAAELVAEAAGGASNNQDPTPLITAMRNAIKGVVLPAGLQVHLAGDTATQADNSKQSGSTNSQVQLASVVFIILLLLLIFRAPLAPLITLIPPIFVVTAAGPLIAELTKTGLKVSSLAQLLLTVLVLGAGADYGLFLIFRVREELRNGLPNREAIVKAMGRVGESITFSAATVMAALLSLLLATFQIYSDLGIPLAIGIGLMLIAGLTLLPALLAIFGRAAFWPSLRRKENRIGLWGRICARVVQRPVLILVVGIIFFGGLALAVPGYQAGGFGGTTAAPTGSDSAAGNALLAKHFPNSSANPTELIYVLPQSVWQNPQPLAIATAKLRQESQFTSATGALSPNGTALTAAQLKMLRTELGPAQSLPSFPPAGVQISPTLYQAYRSTADYISANGRTVLFAVKLKAGDPSTTPAMNAVPAIRAQAAQVSKAMGATTYGVVGEAPAFYDISSISNHDLLRVVPVAILVIGILLAILLRSLVAPLYLVASVAMSYLAALGLAVLFFIDFNSHSNGIVFILPFLMFIFLLALGEDYNILVMTRIREEAHTLPLKQAVTKALNTTGTTVTSAGLVLAGTFTVLGVVGGAGEVRDIGFGLAAGILMDTFLVRTLLVPAIVVLLGRWNWWPSKHGSWVGEE
jgi:putative drug exporter of the RND superfamily